MPILNSLFPESSFWTDKVELDVKEPFPDASTYNLILNSRTAVVCRLRTSFSSANAIGLSEGDRVHLFMQCHPFGDRSEIFVEYMTKLGTIDFNHPVLDISHVNLPSAIFVIFWAVMHEGNEEAAKERKRIRETTGPNPRRVPGFVYIHGKTHPERDLSVLRTPLLLLAFALFVFWYGPADFGKDVGGILSRLGTGLNEYLEEGAEGRAEVRRAREIARANQGWAGDFEFLLDYFRRLRAWVDI